MEHLATRDATTKADEVVAKPAKSKQGMREKNELILKLKKEIYKIL